MLTSRYLKALALLWILAPADFLAASEQPNILIILSDDHGVGDAGAYGNTVINTPNIDRLASEGMLFQRAFTTEAICTPSRSSLYTGLYPMRHGAHRNHTQVIAGTKSLPHYFRPLGYRVALAGKRHIGPVSAFPFEYLEASGNTINDSQSMIAGYLDAIGGVFNDPSQPFLLVVATSLPHAQPGLKTGFPQSQLYAPSSVPLPGYLVDTTETRAARAGYYDLVSKLDEDVGTLMTQLAQSPAAKNTLVIYASDHGAGFAFEKWTNYDGGIRVPFIVRWPGKVAPGKVSYALVSFVDVVPTLLQLAGYQQATDVDGESFADILTGHRAAYQPQIFATHTSLGIRNAKAAFPIRSVRSERYKYIRNLNPTATFTNNVTEKGLGGWNSWVQLAATDKSAARQVQRYQHRPAEELYDVVTDPYELNNLAADAAYSNTLVTMRQQLNAWMSKQKDQGLAAPATKSNITWHEMLTSALLSMKNRWNALFN